MFMLLLTVVIVGVTAYIWSIRGFFSALIHMVCVIAAGAVAFGVWEPLSYLLLENAGDRGFGGDVGAGAWAVCLALPFAVTLAVLRAGVDKLLPFNAQCETAVDYVGGAVCGLVSGVISAGIVVLSVGYLRLEPDFGGYKPVVFSTGTGRGCLEQTPDTFIPWVDRITAQLYSGLSQTAFRTPDPLARWHPDLATEGGAMRTTFEGKSRNVYKPGSFDFLGWYTVGNPPGNGPIAALTQDAWDSTEQKPTDLHGNPITNGYIAGFNLKFKSLAKEKTGQVVVGNGQVRLIVENNEDETETKALHPISLVTNIEDPTKVEYARFKYNTDEMYIASVGGASEASMAFEFPVPTGWHPIALYVKGVRVDLEDKAKPVEYADPAARDEKIQAGEMAGLGGVGPILDANGNPVAAAPSQVTNAPSLTVTNSIGQIIQRGSEQGVEVAQEGRGWVIRDGEMKLNIDQLKGRNSGIEPSLQINRFSSTEDTVVVQVDVSPTRRNSDFLTKYDAADKDKPIVLVDTNGTKYEAVGYVFQDPSIFQLRYTKGQPLKGTGESGVPSISRSTPNRQLKFVFSVSLGVSIRELRIGDKVIDTFDPPIKCDQRQK